MNWGMLHCVDCTISLHSHLPLHRVEVCIVYLKRYQLKENVFSQKWNGNFFEKDSLQNLGFRYQLGHCAGTTCPCSHPGAKNFIVFDISGPHFVTIDYCGCSEEDVPLYTQLLREKWFPATLSRPQTAFTFECMEFFHELTLQGKTNMYDFYHTLLRIFDNADFSNVIVSKKNFVHFVSLINI